MHAFLALTGCRLARPCVAAMSPVGGSVSFDHRAARRSWGGKRGSPGGFVVGRSRRFSCGGYQTSSNPCLRATARKVVARWRSEQGSVGKEWVGTCRSRGTPDTKTQQQPKTSTKL